MATRETSNGTRTIERLTNEGTPGFYTGNPLVKTRDLTTAEAADLAAVDAANVQATNGQTLTAQATTALTSNRTYLALASPSTAQNTAQLKALTRQMNAVIRLVLGQLDGTD